MPRKKNNKIICETCDTAIAVIIDKKNLADKVKELRVWYTGATRSKNTLHLLGTYHQYNFPLGKYFKQYEASYDK